MSVMYFRLNFEAASDHENHVGAPKFDILKKAYNIGLLNSHHTRWFSTTNDPLLCIYQVLNEVISEKLFKGLPFKINSATSDGISSNRKFNF